MDRRAFLGTVGRATAGACVACGLAGARSLHGATAAPDGSWTRQIDFYEPLPDGRIQCFVCPLHCVLNDGETCFCRTRTNHGGKLYTHAYNNPCILRTDPIEKMPLNHYRPGSRTLTIGLGGCNVRCVYCQNWQQSQCRPERLETYALTAGEAVAAARRKGLDTIAFNYTEPIAFLEYAKDVAAAAKEAGLGVAVATAAFVDPEPLLDFARFADAFVVALKGFDEEFYKRACGVALEPVLTAIKALKRQTSCWLELVNLVVPTYNDDPEQIGGMVRWIKQNVGVQTPLHFARFVPMYKLTNLPQTPVQTLEQARRIGLEAGLRFVYTSNIAPHEGTSTFCHRCGHPVIERLGLKVLENRLANGTCPNCRHHLPGVWA